MWNCKPPGVSFIPRTRSNSKISLLGLTAFTCIFVSLCEPLATCIGLEGASHCPMCSCHNPAGSHFRRNVCRQRLLAGFLLNNKARQLWPRTRFLNPLSIHCPLLTNVFPWILQGVNPENEGHPQVNLKTGLRSLSPFSPFPWAESESPVLLLLDLKVYLLSFELKVLKQVLSPVSKYFVVVQEQPSQGPSPLRDIDLLTKPTKVCL